MAGNSRGEAVRNFLHPLEGVLACVTPCSLVYDQWPIHDDDETTYKLVLKELGSDRNSPPGIMLVAEGTPLRFLVVIDHSVVETAVEGRGPWKVSTLRYAYTIETEDTLSYIDFHWHPDELGQTPPHVHVGPLGAQLFVPEDGYNIPTGRIAVEQVVRLLIEQFHVTPRRYEWDAVLADSQATFERWASWL